MTCHVLGLGPSIKSFRPDGNLTIGCNDIYRYHETDIVIVVSNLPYNRAIFVHNARPKMLLSHMPRWYAHPSFERLPEMLHWRSDRENVLKNGIFKSTNTPFIAATYAFSLGFTEIVLWGVDFTDHPLIKDTYLETTKLHFSQLQEALLKNRASMFLGNSGSTLNLPLWKSPM